jgi:CRP-like cAMP-binding protein
MGDADGREPRKIMATSLPNKCSADDPVLQGRAYKARTHHYLARDGEPLTHLHLLLEGFACRYRLLPDGRRQITHLYLPGDLCDPSWLYADHVFQSIVSLTSLQTVQIEKRQVVDEAQARPAVAKAIGSEVLRRDLMHAEWSLNLGRKNAVERIAHLFCELTVRLDHVGLLRDGNCNLPLTQLDIADLMGLTPVHVNRVIRELRESNLAVMRSRQLLVPDLERLAQVGLFDRRYLEIDRDSRAHSLIGTRNGDLEC